MNVNPLNVRTGIAAILVMVVAGCFAEPAGAQTYPSGPIRIIVPYAAGGLADALARVTGARIAGRGRPAGHRRQPARRELDARHAGLRQCGARWPHALPRGRG